MKKNEKKALIERILNEKLQGSRGTTIGTQGTPTAGDDECYRCLINCSTKPGPDGCKIKMCGGPECHDECVSCEY